MAGTDSFKFKWPTIRGREDMRVALFFWTDVTASAEYDVTVFDRFQSSAHNDDNTSTADQPIATATTVEIDTVGGTITNKLIVTYSGTKTGLIQDSGFTNGKIDVWGIDPSGTSGRVKLAEAVWALDRSVTVVFT